MNKKNVYVVKRLITNDSLDELDFVLYDLFNFDYDNFEHFHEIEQGKEPYTSATPLLIDTLIEKLKEFKKKGATHVEIEDNCDHNGYDISVFEIRNATEEEIEKFEKKHQDRQSKEKKINQLYNEIAKLEKDIQK